MTRKQRSALAFFVIRTVADRIEAFDLEALPEDCAGLNEREAIGQIVKWLGKLPGDRWDMRLPEPSVR